MGVDCGRVGGVFLFLCNWCFVCFFLFNGASFGRFVLRMVCGVVMYGFCLVGACFFRFFGGCLLRLFCCSFCLCGRYYGVLVLCVAVTSLFGGVGFFFVVIVRFVLRSSFCDIVFFSSSYDIPLIIGCILLFSSLYFFFRYGANSKTRGGQYKRPWYLEC